MAVSGTYFIGFDHLIGETVVVLADGYVHANVVVDDDGGITLTREATEVIVGLPYTPKLKTMKIEAGAELGSSQGDIKRIHRALIALYKTGECLAGPDEDTTEELSLEDSLFTGDVVMDFPGNPELQGQVYITSDSPLPLTVLMIGMKGVTYES
jgi:hypothetical protein